LNGTPDTDLDKLSSLKAFSWLSASGMRLLAGALEPTNFKRREVILREGSFASEAHILLKGIARITCQNARSERVTVALIAPGPIPELPPPMSHIDLRCEAYNNCRVGTLNWKGFEGITLNSRESALRKFHQNDLKHLYRLLRRTSGLLNLDLHGRVALTMLDLCEDFGIEDSRGRLLAVSFSHRDIADLVGASRPMPGPQTRRVAPSLGSVASSPAITVYSSASPASWVIVSSPACGKIAT
jgi:CRP-like cAMP-binding protein